MSTNYDIAKALTALNELMRLILGKLNRVEAAVANQRVVAADPAMSATATSIAILERAIEATQSQTEEYRRILADMRNPRRGR